MIGSLFAQGAVEGISWAARFGIAVVTALLVLIAIFIWRVFHQTESLLRAKRVMEGAAEIFRSPSQRKHEEGREYYVFRKLVESGFKPHIVAEMAALFQHYPERRRRKGLQGVDYSQAVKRITRKLKVSDLWDDYDFPPSFAELMQNPSPYINSFDEPS